MSKIMLETTMWDEPKFVDAPYLAITLYVKALAYAANARTDGFVPSTKARELVKKASSRAFANAVDHLTTAQPGCVNPSWEERAGGWYIHDYDDPQYANTLREDIVQAARSRQLNGHVGGLKSAAARRVKYGTAQPVRSGHADSPSSKPEANPEVPFDGSPEVPFDATSEQSPEATPEATSKSLTSPGPSLPLHISPTSKALSASKATSVARERPVDAIGNGQTDDPVLKLGVGMHDLLGHALSGQDAIACQAALNQYAYMDAEALLQRAREHIAHCQSQVPPLPTPRTVAGFSETWRSQNDWLADHGAQKAWRPSRLPAGLTRVGDMLPATAVQRDPDE